MKDREKVLTVISQTAKGVGSIIFEDFIASKTGLTESEVLTVFKELVAETPPLIKCHRYIFEENGNRITISQGEIEEATQTGELYHPETGERIEGDLTALFTSYTNTKHLRLASDDYKTHLQTIIQMAREFSCEHAEAGEPFDSKQTHSSPSPACLAKELAYYLEKEAKLQND